MTCSGKVPRRLTFGSAADAYEQYRPSYPIEVVDLVRTYSRGDLRAALEVGAGTGLATRLFAGDGLSVTASDPDADMLTVLRRTTTGLPVTAVLSSFEDLPMTRRYDLVYAAAAWHWTSRAGRWDRVAALLRAEGTFATFGGQTRIADPDLHGAVADARRFIVAVDDVASPDGTPEEAAIQWPGTELLHEPFFTDVEQHRVERGWETTSAAYVGLRSTVSAYLVLPAPDRAVVLERIRQVLPPRFALTATITVHLARRC